MMITVDSVAAIGISDDATSVCYASLHSLLLTCVTVLIATFLLIKQLRSPL